MYAGRTEAVARVNPERSLTDLLTNRRFVIDGARPAPLTAGVVVGVVSDVEPGKAYIAPGEGATSQEVAFDDEDALWRTVDLVVQVEERLGFEDQSTTIRLTVPVNGSLPFDTYRKGMTTMGPVVFVVDHGREGGYTVHWAGAFFAPVDSTGKFHFEALGDEGGSLQGLVDTLDELRAEASKPPVIITSDLGGQHRSEPTPAPAP
ncbi:hypothetical protein [Cellulomonas massiliensis]|uniref:hypothetical protein n=1 Tax=Cellulomonas massiliensis TaxID=1465811 RepID=UPI0013762EF3|nr:hypothetical protein [Cellulomonas massiliensis]